MSQNERDLYEDRIAGLLSTPPGAERQRILEEFSGPDRDEAEKLVRLADLVWVGTYSAPEVTNDPVAAALGLVPDPEYRMDPAAFAKARAAARVKPTDLAAALARRGWPVTVRDVFTWETRTTADVSPALVRAVARELHTEPDRLTTPRAGNHAPLAVQQSKAATVAAKVAATSRFQNLVGRFAQLQGVSSPMAASALRSRMLMTVHRGDQPDEEQMLLSVEALVEALEAE